MRVQPRATQPCSGPRALGAVILVLFVLDQCQALKLAQCRLIAGPRLREPAGCEHRPSRISEKRNHLADGHGGRGSCGEATTQRRLAEVRSKRVDKVGTWAAQCARGPCAGAHSLEPGVQALTWELLRASLAPERSIPADCRQMRANSWAPRMHYPAQRAGVKNAPQRTEAHAR